MNDTNIVYILIFLFCGLVFAGFGIYALMKKTPVHFWSGSTVKSEEIKDIKAYNRANGIMWIAAGLVIGLSGFASIVWDLNIVAIISTFSVIFMVVIMMILYTKIYNKYKVK